STSTAPGSRSSRLIPKPCSHAWNVRSTSWAFAANASCFERPRHRPDSRLAFRKRTARQAKNGAFREAVRGPHAGSLAGQARERLGDAGDSHDVKLVVDGRLDHPSVEVEAVALGRRDDDALLPVKADVIAGIEECLDAFVDLVCAA